MGRILACRHFRTRFPPCSPVTTKNVPVGDAWLHEVKFDGYRVQAHKAGSRVVIYSRNGQDFTERFPSIAQLLRSSHLAFKLPIALFQVLTSYSPSAD
jgi:ATP-dependent DNA ligase